MMEWISVSERMPDDSREVLIWNVGTACSEVHIAHWFDDRWRVSGYEEGYSLVSKLVTHWAELPKGPGV